MATIPINDDQSQSISVPIEDPGMVAVNKEAAKVNAISDANRGLDPAAAWDSGHDPLDKFSTDLKQRRAEDLMTERQALAAAGGDTTALDAQALSTQADLDGTNGLLGVYRQKAAELVQGGKLSAEGTTVDELAFSIMYSMEFAEEFGNVGLGETVADIAGTFIPMRETYNLVELGAELGFVDGILDTAKASLDPGGLLDKFRSVASSLEPKDRASLFKQMQHNMKDLDNNILKSSIMQYVFKGDYDPNLVNLFNALDVVDIGTSVVGAGISAVKGLKAADKFQAGNAVSTAAANLMKTGRLVNMIRRAPTPEAYEMAGQMAHTPIGKVADITPADMADMHNPMMHGDIGERLTGIPDDKAAEITAMMDHQNAIISKLEADLIREGAVTEQRASELIAEAEAQVAKVPYAVNVKVQRDSTGFSLTYDTARFNTDTMQMERVTQEPIRHDFQLSDQGTMDIDLDKDYVDSWWRWDINTRTKNRLNHDLVQIGQRVTREQSKVINALERSLQVAYSGLKEKDVARLDKILMKGSKDGKEYNYSELKSMWPDPKDEKLIKAYFGQRNFTRQLFDLKNQTLVDQMLAIGVKLVDGPDGQVAARSFDSPEAARKAFLEDDPDSFSILALDDGVPGITKGERLQLDTAGALQMEQVEDAYRRGYQLVRNYHKKNYFSSGNYKTEWAFVKTDKIHSPRGRRVLNQVDGYIPKARKNSFYFIKRKGDVEVSDGRVRNGERTKTFTTVAWADSYEDAVAHANRLGGKDEGYEVLFDREMDPASLEGDMLLVQGGMFGSKRKAEELPYVGRDVGFEYEDPTEMMQLYINHLGKQVPAHLWRLGMEQRAIDLAKEFMPGQNIHNVEDIMAAAKKVNLRPGDKKYNLLQDMTDQIHTIAGIPTDAEKEMALRFERAGNFLEGYPKLKPLAKLFYKAAQRNLNIHDKIRGVTFMHMLGMYNPAQFLVQFSGALTAFAVNPVSAIKAGPKLIGWQMLDAFHRNPLTQKKAADWLRSQGLGKYAEEYEIWARSGFRESVVSANSDMATLFGNKPYDASAMQRVLANNRFFYEAGELAMSRASLATAIEWYKDLKKVSKIDLKDTEALDAIYNRAEQYRLNMGKANQSALNKGWKGVTFQFQQVISKYYEKVFNDEFTKAERVRLFAVPAVMMGGVGVPGFNFAVEQIANYAGADLEKMEPEQVSLLQAGVLGWMLNDAADINVDFSSRMTLGTDLWDNMFEMVTGGGGNALALAMGPSGHVAVRYTQGAQYLGTAFDLTRESEEFTVDEVLLMAKVFSDAVTSLPSGTRNMRDFAPFILGNSKAFMRDGRFLWEWEDMNTQTAVMAALGFQPNEMVDLYDMMHKLQDRPRDGKLRFFNEQADVISHVISTGMLSTDKEDRMQLYSKIVHAALTSVDPVDRPKLAKQVWENLHKPEYDVNDIFRKLRMHNMTHMEDGVNFLNRLFAKKTKDWENPED